MSNNAAVSSSALVAPPAISYKVQDGMLVFIGAFEKDGQKYDICIKKTVDGQGVSFKGQGVLQETMIRVHELATEIFSSCQNPANIKVTYQPNITRVSEGSEEKDVDKETLIARNVTKIYDGLIRHGSVAQSSSSSVIILEEGNEQSIRQSEAIASPKVSDISSLPKLVANSPAQSSSSAPNTPRGHDSSLKISEEIDVSHANSAASSSSPASTTASTSMQSNRQQSTDSNSLGINKAFQDQGGVVTSNSDTDSDTDSETEEVFHDSQLTLLASSSTASTPRTTATSPTVMSPSLLSRASEKSQQDQAPIATFTTSEADGGSLSVTSPPNSLATELNKQSSIAITASPSVTQGKNDDTSKKVSLSKIGNNTVSSGSGTDSHNVIRNVVQPLTSNLENSGPLNGLTAYIRPTTPSDVLNKATESTTKAIESVTGTAELEKFEWTLIQLASLIKGNTDWETWWGKGKAFFIFIISGILIASIIPIIVEIIRGIWYWRGSDFFDGKSFISDKILPRRIRQNNDRLQKYLGRMEAIVDEKEKNNSFVQNEKQKALEYIGKIKTLSKGYEDVSNGNSLYTVKQIAEDIVKQVDGLREYYKKNSDSLSLLTYDHEAGGIGRSIDSLIDPIFDDQQKLIAEWQKSQPDLTLKTPGSSRSKTEPVSNEKDHTQLKIPNTPKLGNSPSLPPLDVKEISKEDKQTTILKWKEETAICEDALNKVAKALVRAIEGDTLQKLDTHISQIEENLKQKNLEGGQELVSQLKRYRNALSAEGLVDQNSFRAFFAEIRKKLQPQFNELDKEDPQLKSNFEEINKIITEYQDRLSKEFNIFKKYMELLHEIDVKQSNLFNNTQEQNVDNFNKIKGLCEDFSECRKKDKDLIKRCNLDKCFSDIFDSICVRQNLLVELLGLDYNARIPDVRGKESSSALQAVPSTSVPAVAAVSSSKVAVGTPQNSSSNGLRNDSQQNDIPSQGASSASVTATSAPAANSSLTATPIRVQSNSANVIATPKPSSTKAKISLPNDWEENQEDLAGYLNQMENDIAKKFSAKKRLGELMKYTKRVRDILVTHKVSDRGTFINSIESSFKRQTTGIWEPNLPPLPVEAQNIKDQMASILDGLPGNVTKELSPLFLEINNAVQEQQRFLTSTFNIQKEYRAKLIAIQEAQKNAADNLESLTSDSVKSIDKLIKSVKGFAATNRGSLENLKNTTKIRIMDAISKGQKLLNRVLGRNLASSRASQTEEPILVHWGS